MGLLPLELLVLLPIKILALRADIGKLDLSLGICLVRAGMFDTYSNKLQQMTSYFR